MQILCVSVYDLLTWETNNNEYAEIWIWYKQFKYLTQLIFTCSKSVIETLEKSVKHVKS